MASTLCNRMKAVRTARRAGSLCMRNTMTTTVTATMTDKNSQHGCRLNWWASKTGSCRQIQKLYMAAVRTARRAKVEVADNDKNSASLPSELLIRQRRKAHVMGYGTTNKKTPHGRCPNCSSDEPGSSRAKHTSRVTAQGGATPPTH